MPEDEGTDDAAATVDETTAEGANAANEALPPPDPVDEAKRLLEQAKNALADAEAKAKRDGEIDKAIAQYRGEQLHLEADEEAMKAKLQEGFEELKPSDQEKASVKKIRDGLQADQNALAAAIALQRKELEAKRGNLAATKKDLEAARDRFEGLKSLGKGVQAKHRAAEGMRKEAFEAIAKKKRRLAYYLLKHGLDTTIEGEPIPIEVDAYVEAIKQASAAYGEQNAKHRGLEAEVQEREKKLADDEKRLADLQRNFEATIRETLAAQP